MADWSYKVRTRNLYDPTSAKPYRISRSKIDLYLECPRCFYMDRRLGVGRLAGFPFNLNSLVDDLLKKEFDRYRSRGELHPLMGQTTRTHTGRQNCYCSKAFRYSVKARLSRLSVLTQTAVGALRSQVRVSRPCGI